MEGILSGLKTLFKKYIAAGALVLVPIAGTAWVLKTVVLWMDDFFKSFLPFQLHPINLIGFDIPGLGVFFTIVLLLLTGVLTRLYLGKKLIEVGDQMLQKLPLGSGVYSLIKQIVNTIAKKDQRAFQKVVLVEYPKAGSYALGFVTGENTMQIQKLSGANLVYVFVPTTPNPTSGFLLIVPKENLIDVDLSVEEAFKFIISGGIVRNHGN